MSVSLPPIEVVPSLSITEKIELLNHLFEKCQILSTFLILKLFGADKKYSTYQQFIEDARIYLIDYLEESERRAAETGQPINPDIAAIIGAHPRLGASQRLSLHSSQEQKSLQQSSEEERKKLEELNSLYESTFPGLRYVVFVNGRPRSVIMEDMLQRIQRNDISKERHEAFDAMCDIALDRASKLGAKF